MISNSQASFLGTCLEGFFYGRIFILCALTCTLAKELFTGLGIYSGIFVMYLQRPQNKSRTATILFYTLCLLYAMSTAAVVGDLVATILEVSTDSICKNIFFYISCTVAFHYTIATTSNRLTVIANSPYVCPSHNKWLLRLSCPVYLSTHKALYLSSVLFT